MDPFSRLIHGVVLLSFLVLLLPVAVLVFIATSAVFVALNWLLGSPTGVVSSALALAWFGGSIALIFLICVLAYRTVPFIRGAVRVSQQVEHTLLGTSSEAPASPTRDPQADAATLSGRVAAADARLAEAPSERASPGASGSA